MDRQNFEQVVPELRLKLLKIALFYLTDEEEAEDVVQDTLLKLWMTRSSINDGKAGMEALGTTIAKNLSIEGLLARAHTTRRIPFPLSSQLMPAPTKVSFTTLNQE